MSKEAMKLALEALDVLLTEPIAHKAADRAEYLLLQAAPAIREALAEQETVLPGGGHVPAVPVAVYGYCPECGGAGVMRERRPNGDDKCTNGHKYPSSKALAEQPAQHEPVAWMTQARNFVHLMEFTEAEAKLYGWKAVYTTPQPAQQEPVAWEQFYPEMGKPKLAYLPPTESTENALYTSPPAQRTWVGLTDDEFGEIYYRFDGMELMRAIEAKLKEKNT